MLCITELLLYVVIALVGAFLWTKNNFSYWRRKKVPFVKPHFLFGNIKEMVMLKKNCGEVIQELYDHKNAKDQPILGIYIFNKPALLIRDPDLIKSILVRNFNKFSDRYLKSDPQLDPLGSGTLFAIKNPQWKELRTKLLPAFSSGKIKQMFTLIQDVGNQLDKYLRAFKPEDDCSSSFTREVKEVCSLFTTDVIATVAFGIKTNCLQNPDDKFRQVGRSVLDFHPLRALQFLITFFLPHLARISRCKLFSRKSEKYFRATINHAIEHRIQSGRTRNDLIDILVQIKQTGSKNSCLDVNNDLLVAQAATFFIAGYETSATTMAFCLFEISKNSEIQKRLREEIRNVLCKNNDGSFSYDDVIEMKYLDMIVMETFRLYPTLPILDRVCTLSNEEKEFSLHPWSDFSIPNNMPVYIPKIGIHKDPKYFPNPDIFDPERFSAENKSKIKAGTFIPFGLGPRGCIGYRLGLLQTKIGLINIFRNHFISLSSKTPKKMMYDPRSLFRQSKSGIFCEFFRDPLI